MEKAFRVTLKLAEGKSPHLYITQIKAMMENDKSLHPMMAKTLKMLKLTRVPFILLPKLKEVVIDPINFRHFDRSADPRGEWAVVLWSKEEIAEHTAHPREHIKAILNFFQMLGYELFNNEVCSPEYIASLEALTIKQIEAEEERMEEINNEN